MNNQDTKNLPSKKRLVTGFSILGVAFLIALLDIKFLTWFSLGIVMLFAFKEMLSILKIDSTSHYIYAVMVWIFAYFYPEPIFLIFGVAVILLANMSFKNSVDYKQLFAFFYPLAPMLFVLMLPIQFGMGSLVWLIFIVGITDTAAYYGGKNMGATPFSAVSPKKTWEGFYSGIVGGTFVGTIVGLFLTNFFTALAISFIVALSSVFGDLFESYLKRQVGIKDSGNILPGHGGMLDRADGYLFGAVVMVIFLKALF